MSLPRSCPPRLRGSGAHRPTRLPSGVSDDRGVRWMAPGDASGRPSRDLSSGRGSDPPCTAASARPGARRARGARRIAGPRPRAPRTPSSSIASSSRVSSSAVGSLMPASATRRSIRRRARSISSSGRVTCIASPREVVGSSEARISESRSTSGRSSSLPRDGQLGLQDLGAALHQPCGAGRGTRARPCIRRGAPGRPRAVWHRSRRGRRARGSDRCVGWPDAPRSRRRCYTRVPELSRPRGASRTGSPPRRRAGWYSKWRWFTPLAGPT